MSLPIVFLTVACVGGSVSLADVPSVVACAARQLTACSLAFSAIVAITCPRRTPE